MCKFCSSPSGAAILMAKANQGEKSVVSLQYSSKRMEKTDGAQKKVELKQGVARLHKMLDYEERVHEILENASRGNVRSIPSFLPTKMKELLAELAMVDDEIARLEHEISILQQNLIEDQKPSGMSKYQSIYHTNVNLFSPFQRSLALPRSSINAKWTHERGPSEARALFFINQAIKGDYTSNGFASSKEKMRHSTGTFDRKGGRREVGLQDKTSRKSGTMEKPFSHKLPPKHPNAKALRNHEMDGPKSICMDETYEG